MEKLERLRCTARRQVHGIPLQCQWVGYLDEMHEYLGHYHTSEEDGVRVEITWATLNQETPAEIKARAEAAMAILGNLDTLKGKRPE